MSGGTLRFGGFLAFCKRCAWNDSLLFPLHFSGVCVAFAEEMGSLWGERDFSFGVGLSLNVTIWQKLMDDRIQRDVFFC